MTLGERIQQCRKAKNISQEELANELNVSRQALSKWECGTSLPEIDKIIALSDYFQVSTDYLLKDAEAACPAAPAPAPTPSAGRGSALMPVIASTAVILIGFILSWAMADDKAVFVYWAYDSAVWGLIIQIVGVALYELLYFSDRFERKGQYLFWGVNTWLLSFMPTVFVTSVAFQFLSGFIRWTYLLMILSTGTIYLVFNAAVTAAMLLLSRRKGRDRTDGR